MDFNILRFYLHKQSFCLRIVAVITVLLSCQKEERNPDFASVTTTTTTNITSTSAKSGGIVTSDGGSSITARGVVWNTQGTPTIPLSTTTSNGSGNGSFSGTITNLTPNTVYFVRAYATNSIGTVYGNEVSFKTSPTGGGGPPPTNSFYKKQVDASGIPVVSSSKVPDAALNKVKEVVDKMLSIRQDVLAKMIQNKIKVGIMAQSEVTTDMPEHSDLNKVYPTSNWDQYRGLGATLERPLSSCAEENVLCYGKNIDPYYNEDILVHEFAHSIHLLGIRFVDTAIDAKLQTAFNKAKSKGLWTNTYAGSNYIEYFAEGVQDWFNVNAEAIPTNGIHNNINTRDELKSYDLALYTIIKEYFPEDTEKAGCH